LKIEEITMPAITVSAIVNTPVARAWEAFTQPEHITQWNFAAPEWHCPTARNDLRVGGEFSSRMEARDGSMGFDFIGIYTSVSPLEHFAYVLGDERRVTVSFESISSEQTRVTEVFDPETQNSEELQRGGWQAILDNYKKHTETL
jgi:uncharacterized protein YndB with AHSA1/START domain